jgi:outer membrane receptor protein involved in Fe transport
MQWTDVRLTVSYSYIDATFRSAFLAASASNSTADADGAIAVEPGDRIPGIPSSTAKVRVDWKITDRWALGGGLIYASSQYAHGDENNQDVHGAVPSYIVVNLDTKFRMTPDLQLFASVSNLFDRPYQNFGLLGANAFTGPGRTFGPAVGIEPAAEQFRGLGAPRGFWLGLRYTFGKA